MRQIAHVDLHDARVNHVSLGAGGAVRIVFDHICVYFRGAPEVFEVWSARAVLHLERVEEISVRGAFQADDYVSEGTLVDGKGAEVMELDVGDFGRSRRLNLVFAGSGSEIRVSMGSASLVVDALNERLEDWLGPLVSQP